MFVLDVTAAKMSALAAEDVIRALDVVVPTSKSPLELMRARSVVPPVANLITPDAFAAAILTPPLPLLSMFKPYAVRAPTVPASHKETEPVSDVLFSNKIPAVAAVLPVLFATLIRVVAA